MAHLDGEHLDIPTMKRRARTLGHVQHAQMMVLAAGLAAVTIVTVAAVVMRGPF